MERLLTADQVAERLQVSRYSVWRWARLGELPALRAGHRIRFRELDVLRFLEDGRK
jgi:excisionase family DNA binding protein